MLESDAGQARSDGISAEWVPRGRAHGKQVMEQVAWAVPHRKKGSGSGAKDALV